MFVKLWQISSPLKILLVLAMCSPVYPALAGDTDAAKLLNDEADVKPKHSQREVCLEALIAPLSADQEKIIKSHSIHRLAQQLKSGKGIAITLSNLEFDVSEVGESIQAQFIRNVLRFLFPEADFSGERGLPGPRIGFSINDSSESGGQRPTMNHYDELLEMPDIKAANGTFSPGHRQRLRQQYGISQSIKIAHVYVRELLGMEDRDVGPWNPNFSMVARKLSALEADVVIVSSLWILEQEYNESPEGEIERDFPRLKEVFPTWVRLTDYLKAPDQYANKKLLIVNDTIGRMSELHQLSNFNVVLGPINFFEALYSGTPTSILLTEANAGIYEKSARDKMLSAAKGFPNYVPLRSLRDLEWPSSLGATYDYGALKQFLDILEGKIRSQALRLGLPRF